MDELDKGFRVGLVYEKAVESLPSGWTQKIRKGSSDNDCTIF
jgi:hypothetical protein